MSENGNVMYGCFRLDKIHAGGELKGQSSHILRKNKSKSNPDIDYLQTKNNTVFASSEHLELRINKRIKELNLKRLRKDAVVCIDAVVGASAKFFDGMNIEKQDEFFKECLDWLTKIVEKENIMYAVVHRDEKGAPHLHVGFVPVTRDNRLCAKDVMSRQNLRNFQDDFYAEISVKYGLERGVKVEEKREKGQRTKHMSTPEYKEYKAVTERLEKFKSRKGEVDEIRKRVKKNFLGDKYTISGYDFRRLATIANDGAIAEHAVRELTMQVRNLQDSVQARDDKIKYEHDVNDTLRAKVHAASAYLAADAETKKRVDAFLHQRAQERRAEKYANLRIGKNKLNNDDKKNRALVSDAEKEREDSKKIMRLV